jgi:hypothetical protein
MDAKLQSMVANLYVQMQSRNTLSKNESSMSHKHDKATQAKMSVSVDWKPERAVQAKIRDINKNDYPDRLKT